MDRSIKLIKTEGWQDNVLILKYTSDEYCYKSLEAIKIIMDLDYSWI